MIVQNVATEGTTEVSFTVAKGDLPETLRAAEAAAREIGAKGVTHDADVAKVSVVGLGMRTHTGVATTMFEALAAAGINIQMITTSEIKISVLVDRASAVPALRAVHQAFQLDEVHARPQPVSPPRCRRPGMKLVPLADPRDRRAARRKGWKTSSSPASSSTSLRRGSRSSTCPTSPATRPGSSARSPRPASSSI